MHTTKNTLPDNAKKSMIDLLQARLAESLDLASQAKQAHWNVKGPSFGTLHELFDSIHQQSNNHSDLIAERLVILGGQAKGTVRSVAKRTTLDEYPLNAAYQTEHVKSFSDALAKFGTLIRNAIDEADEVVDKDTADLFTEVSRAVDKSLWMVEAHLPI